MMNHAKTEAKRLSEQAGYELEAALKRREQQATDRIAQAETDALAQIRSMAVDLAVRATRQLLSENLDPAKAQKLVDDSVKDLPDKLH